MIDVKDLSKSFGNHQIFKNINLHVDSGEILGIIGPSGSGKSTFLRCLNLLETPDEGRVSIGNISYNAKKISRKKKIEVRKQSTMVFQQFNLFRQKRVWENVAEALIIVGKFEKTIAKEKAMNELEKVGLSEYANFYPGQLSGGQKQRVAIARSLVLNRKILLLDEPTSALDSELVGGVLEILKKVMLAHPEYTIILVSHELEFVKQVATKVIFFEDGRILEAGTAEQVLGHPQQERTKVFLRRFNYK